MEIHRLEVPKKHQLIEIHGTPLDLDQKKPIEKNHINRFRNLDTDWVFDYRK